MVTIADITAIKEKEQKLEQSAIFFEHSEEGILITNHKNEIVSVNNAFCKITGYTKDDVIGRKPSFLASGIHDKSFYKHMWDCLKNRNSWNGEIWNKRKNGEVYPQWLSISKVKSNDHVDYYIAMFTDLTALKEADKKIHYYANHDSLTDLLNRVSFEKKLSNSIYNSLSENHQFAIFFIDVDNFKYINDTYGHDIGDEILIIIARRIKRIVKDIDTFARIGGDEFTLIQENIKDIKNVHTLAKKILDTVSQTIYVDKNKFNVTLSIGIAIYPDDAQERKDLLKAADTAMYVVKENGRNGYKLFEKEFTKHVERRFQVQNKLKNAIENEEIYPAFQPFYDLKTGKLIGAEALARWDDKEEGSISPEVFIEYAEGSDLIYPLTELIIEKSCYVWSLLNDENTKDLKLAINISGKYFYDKKFEKFLDKTVERFGLNKNNIELELTETFLMQNFKYSSKIIERLFNKGYSIALDDFGTGYSSLNYLKNFKINKLKIDKSFTNDCHTHKHDLQIIHTIIQMGKILGYEVHAEGVEIKEQLEILKDLDCDSVQGYYYSKAISNADFLKLVKDGK